MIDLNYMLLLTIVVTLTTVLLTMVGIQLFLVLRDLRRLLKKANYIADELERVGVSFSHGYSEISGFLSSLKGLMYVVKLVTEKRKGRQSGKK